eukprot:22777-Pleurochrysis_carterae.AAC.1
MHPRISKYACSHTSLAHAHVDAVALDDVDELVGRRVAVDPNIGGEDAVPTRARVRNQTIGARWPTACDVAGRDRPRQQVKRKRRRRVRAETCGDGCVLTEQGRGREPARDAVQSFETRLSRLRAWLAKARRANASE